jgi:ubiquinone/menaquinone biosynthesis C-methylase UbiE
MGIEKQGAKPTGKNGYFMGQMMNLFHTGIYKKYYNKALIQGTLHILDIGCGGGKFIQYLSKKCHEYTLYGLDHSDEMIALSEKVNKELIERNKVFITKGSVMNLPYQNGQMDIVSAHETIQFWPDIEKSFSEIYRILKPGGSFHIINRFPKEGSKWWKLANLKNEIEYETAFEKAGFSSFEIDLKSKKGFIITKATK